MPQLARAPRDVTDVYAELAGGLEVPPAWNSAHRFASDCLIMYADVISKNTEKGHTMHEDWTEQDHFPDGTTYLGIGPENEDDDLVLLAPITTDEGAPYGVYFSGNPAIVFGRLHLPYVLSLAPAEAVTWLLNDLTDAERHRGEPFYVRGTR